MATITGDEFLQPTPIERVFNRLFGRIVGSGLGLRHNYLLEVTGRKSGQLFATPIDLLTLDGRKFLVCPRGRSQWVRNAEASGHVWLKRGATRVYYAIRPVPDADKSALLRTYLTRFKLTVYRYFPVPAHAPVSDFVPIANRYPVFELIVPVTPGDSNR
jgi:deazaflavin-dependent oxidoreductase (nitroreductase family)